MEKFNNILSAIKFNESGLVPAISQQFNSGEVLMMAWMNKDSIIETLATSRVCYFSRSRNKLWRKGESSGQLQFLKEMLIDCDGDTILLKVDQTGVACHTGRRSCFFNSVSAGQFLINQEVIIAPSELYEE
jgi:phosphoribosyl-AMP cyclohydrolase